ncbi:MAG: DUF4783 domain-containing protein [Bacteroidia bacterium]
MKGKIIVALLFFAFSIPAFADTFEEVIVLIKNSNHKELTKFFNSTVELTVLENEGVYSRQQADVILTNFFTQNPPTAVIISHRGSSAQGSKYAIATYETAKGKFKVYIFMKDSPTGMMIQELRFEKE